MNLEEWLGVTLSDHAQHFNIQRRLLEDLVGYHLGLSWGELQLQKQRALDDELIESLAIAVRRLAAGEPLAYIIGEKFFFKSMFSVDSRVLIPRPETEILVEKALPLLDHSSKTVLDLGTGSGCIGLSLAKERPQSRFYLIDSSLDALAVCRVNQDSLRLDNVTIVHGTVGKASFDGPWDSGAVDLIVANPPYIAEGDDRVTSSVHGFEPHSALYTGEEGLECHRLWLEWSFRQLRPGGHFLFEFGKDQEDPIAAFIHQTDYSIIEVVEDYARIKRFFILQK